MKLGIWLVVEVVWLMAPLYAHALGEPKYVSATPVEGGFVLESEGRAAPLLVSDKDWPGVVRAVGDLSEDVGRVTGHAAPVINAPETAKGEVVLIGTIGRSPLIDALIKAKKLDTSGVAGKWESAVTTIVDHPMPGVRRALVIAGSDKRGTIFGIYDLSEQIGVSPWYWWADVRDATPGCALCQSRDAVLQPAPAVQYRGIFLNDEAPALIGWVNEKFGGIQSRVLHECLRAAAAAEGEFSLAGDVEQRLQGGRSANPKLADEYGIVMGTSHEEPMMRAQQEWKRASRPVGLQQNAKANR